MNALAGTAHMPGSAGLAGSGTPPQAGAEPTEPGLRLEDARARVRAAWEGVRHDPLPLPVVAAHAVHEALGARSGTVSRADYEVSLNLAAAALARLVPICRLDREDGWVELGAPGAGGGRFTGGATALRRAHGEIVAPLAVRRLDADLALRFLRKHGLGEGLPLYGRPGEGRGMPRGAGLPIAQAPGG